MRYPRDGNPDFAKRYRGQTIDAPPPPYSEFPDDGAIHGSPNALNDIGACASHSPSASISPDRRGAGSDSSNQSFDSYDASSSRPDSPQSSYHNGSEYNARQGFQGQLEKVAQKAIMKGINAAITNGCQGLARRHPRFGRLVMEICSQLTADSDEMQSPSGTSFMTGRNSSAPRSIMSSCASASSW